MMVGPDWTSDFTAKSDNNFEVDYSLGVSDLTIMIRNANAIDTYWTGHVEIEVIADAT